MEPKFQSSFIPKGPIATSASRASTPVGGKSIFGFLSSIVFTITVILCAGIFGYNWYLSYHISKVGAELDEARAQIDAESVREIISLDKRILSTKEILNNHVIITPLFDFLEDITLQSVRYTDFNFLSGEEGLELRMGGQARGYSAVALQAEAFSQSQYLNDPVFSDLKLDDAGNVVFSIQTNVDPSLVSYRRIVERDMLQAQPVLPTVESGDSEEEQATSTEAVSTSSPQTEI